jgi:hypothetical protein
VPLDFVDWLVLFSTECCLDFEKRMYAEGRPQRDDSRMLDHAQDAGADFIVPAHFQIFPGPQRDMVLRHELDCLECLFRPVVMLPHGVYNRFLNRQRRHQLVA